MRDRQRPSHPKIAEDSPAGEAARREMGEAIVGSQTSVYLTDGTALGYVYEPAPVCWSDATRAPPHSIGDYRPTTRPGARAPHAWLPDGRSTLDLFGRGFVLLRLGSHSPRGGSIRAAAAAANVPLDVIDLVVPSGSAPYQSRLVLVSPDGHVAWRADTE